jgi:hypothetical protein
LSGYLLTDFLDAVSPTYMGKALRWITSMQATVEGREKVRVSRGMGRFPESDVGVVQELSARAPESTFDSPRPWDIGYQQARIVRSHVAPDSQVKFAVDQYVTARIRKAPDVNLQALGTGADHASSVAS